MNIRNEFRKPAWVSDWKIFVLFAAISFCFAFGLRAMEFPKWDNPSFMVDGEYIMGTHDAYYWMAGAKGVGSAVNNPMAEVLRFIGSITGIPYGNIAFWLPAIFAGFTAVAAFAWGMLVGGPWVGVAGAIYATSIPSFYFRTRLSFYDTDIVTLFFPLLISFLVASWVIQGMRKGWLKSDDDQYEFQPLGWDYLLIVFAGLTSVYGRLWHANVQIFSFAVLLTAIGLSLLCGNKRTRPILLRGLVLFALSFLPFFWGMGIGIVLCVISCLSSVREHKLYNSLYVYLSLIALIIIFNGSVQGLVHTVDIKLGAYLKPVADTAASVAGPKFPGIAQSVIEAQNLNFQMLFDSLTGSPFLGWLAFGAFAFSLLLVPSLLFLIPFGLISFAAIVMGGRFSMFGGIVLGIGLSYFFKWAFIQFVPKRKDFRLAGLLSCFLAVFLLMFNIGGLYKRFLPSPIMTKAHAKALIATGENISKESTVWTWWDWGYATMYYAGARTFANGGHHVGKILFPLGLAYSTPSMLQSSQVIKYSAMHGNLPADTWKKMSAAQVDSLLRSFGDRKYNFPKTPKQYIVTSWSDIRLMYWVLYYGAWNVRSGVSMHPRVSGIHKPFDLDSENGIIRIAGERPINLSGFEVLDSNKLLSQRYKHEGPTLLYNKADSQGFLIDDFARSSTLLRLLIADPRKPEISRYFRLVYEGFPLVRVYEVI